MKIVLNHTLRSIRARIGQPIVITLTIVVVTFLLFASLSLKDVFYNFQVANLSRIAQDADVSVEGQVFSGEKLNEFIGERSDDVEYVQPFLSMVGLVEGRSDESTVVRVEATDVASYVARNPSRFSYLSGIKEVDREFGKEEDRSYVYPGVLIGRSLAEELDLKAGDEIEIYLSFFGRKAGFTVTYIFENEGFFANSNTYDVLTDLNGIGDKGLYTEAYIGLKDGVDIDAFIGALTAHFDNPELTIGEAVDYDYVNDLVRSNEKLLTVALLFIIALVVFILLSAYRIVARNRSEEMTVFKAAGATPSQIFMILLGEVVLYGLIGGIVGVICSRFAMGLVVMKVIPSYTDAVVYEPWYYVAAVLLAVVISVLGALVPMIGLAKKTVKTLGAEGAKQVKKVSPVYAVVCAVLIAASVVCIFFVREWIEVFTGVLIAASVGLLLTGAPYLVAGVSALFSRANGVVRLASANVKRNAESISIARMIGAVIVFAFVIVNVVNVIIDASRPYTMRFDSDYVVQSMSGSERIAELSDRIGNTRGVLSSDAVCYETFDYDFGEKRSDITLYAVDRLGDLSVRDRLTEKEAMDFDNGKNTAIVGYDLMERMGLKKGGKITLELQGETYAFTIVAVDECKTSNDRVLFVKRESLRFTPSEAMIFVNTSKDMPRDDLYGELRSYVEGEGAFILQFEKWAYAVGLAIGGLQTLLRLLQVLVGLVGLVGIVNMTISMMSTRTREFSVLRATGLDGGKYVSLLACESLLISASGCLMGTLLSFVCSVPTLSFAALIDRHLAWQAPWYVFLIALVVAVLYLAAYLFVGSRGKKGKITDKLRF